MIATQKRIDGLVKQAVEIIDKANDRHTKNVVMQLVGELRYANGKVTAYEQQFQQQRADAKE